MYSIVFFQTERLEHLMYFLCISHAVCHSTSIHAQLLGGGRRHYLTYYAQTMRYTASRLRVPFTARDCEIKE